MASLPPPSPFPPPAPPSSPPPPSAPAPQKKSRAGLVGAGVAVAAVVVGGLFFALRGGGDSASPSTSAAVSSTEAATTTVGDTLVITTPENPPTTVGETVPETLAPVPGPTPGENEVVVTDDTGLFQVLAPADFEVDTAPLDIDGLSVASVTAALSLVNYDVGYDETGYTVMALPAELAADAEAALTVFNDQLTGDCDPPMEMPDLDTAIGPARHLVAQGCRDNGSTAVVLAIDETNTGLVFAVLAQGAAGPAEVTRLAQAVLESIYIN